MLDKAPFVRMSYVLHVSLLYLRLVSVRQERERERERERESEAEKERESEADEIDLVLSDRKMSGNFKAWFDTSTPLLSLVVVRGWSPIFPLLSS